jgi:hypothetical protein
VHGERRDVVGIDDPSDGQRAAKLIAALVQVSTQE